MSNTPSMNHIVERQNRRIQDMVRRMMAESSLHIRLWGEALKIAIYLLNRVPTKATIKTPYELWMGRKPSLKYLHIWGCPAQVRPYVPKDRKLDSKIISCYFVGYSEKSWGFKFYVLALEVSLKQEMHISLRILNLMGKIKLETLTFKKNTMIVLIQKVI